MKRILLPAAVALVATLVTGCHGTPSYEGKCHIVGTIPQQYNDKRIFLVPLTGPATAANVDSVEIRDGRFEFVSDTLMMGKILVDYHYRMGLQPLLVVVEPGEVRVVIDSVSHATGTPQNDSLEKWKQATENHGRQLGSLRRAGRQSEADSIHLVYKKFTRSMASNLKEGLLHDFLADRYPLTYKKKLPDGRIATFDSDTNEEIVQ